jgi:RND family efflux transporter MFP subunit
MTFMETNQAPTTAQNASDPSDPTSDDGKAKFIALICLAVVAAGALVAFLLAISAPKAVKRAPAKIATLVRVQTVYPQTQSVVIHAMGTVQPARELTLKSRVAGEIIAVHPEFTAGGILRKGEQIAQIDDVDYHLIVAQKQSAVADASYALKLELGRQDVARREWALLKGDNPATEADTELVLRKPHLEKARSDLVAAQAELEAANLQLARTKIRAPFNAIIRATSVERGSQVAAQESLATLAGTDQYWVQVSVPVDRLHWISVADNHTQPGARADITYQGGAVRNGRVVKLLSDLEAQGRMARLIIAVQDPLGLKAPSVSQPAMLIGEYVRVAIQGSQIESAYRIPREALRDNTHVWVADKAGKLTIRIVETLWRDTQTVILKQGLQPGDQVVVSDLATPVEGMAVQVENNGSDPIKPASTTSAAPGQG